MMWLLLLGWWLVRRDDGVRGRFLDVEAGCEGFGAGAGEDDGAGGGAGGEVGEEGRELVPHSVILGLRRLVIGGLRGGWFNSSLKAFIFSGRLISTWATKGSG